ncbi:MAG TPA: hypothetical protein VJM31_03110 [Vicinamibacterales bacterium]|nr:hypothetical protein [Vicinamibacterales bacterium]
MSNNVKATQSILSFATAIVLTIATADAQTLQPEPAWQWSLTGNIFAGLNYQHRRFDDVRTVESQNWFMGTGERPVGRGRLTVRTMLSLEPFTLKKLGSPQAFQTGETFNNARLIDYQHPHDLFSTLSASYARPVGSWTLTTSAAAVGAPALGPPSFMHRPSATENPQSPLAHHHLDSVHITPGVLSVGVSRLGVGLEGSWFRGREPDERRTDIDWGSLDSWSLRGSWSSDPWSAQLSGARVNEPEPLSPGDMARLMASVSHTRSGPISTALFAAWGHNRESHGTSNALLFESNISWLERNHLFSRAERVGKELPHTHAGALQPAHDLMNVSAFTLGYTRDLLDGSFGRIGLGGDATMYYVPRELQESYGAPLSFHLFLRYRFSAPVQAEGGHHH